MRSNIPIAHYDPYTREFLGITMALLDPEESKKQGREIPLVPGSATLLIPELAPEGKANVFNEETGAWEQVEDHRGKTYWLANGEQASVKDLGPLKPEWLQKQPIPSLDDVLKYARSVRNGMLAESDWTQIPDAPLTNAERDEWRACRKDLRDAPEHLMREWEAMPDAYKRAWRSPTQDMIMDLIGREPWA